MLPEFFQFQAPTKLVFRAGLAADCAAELEQARLTKPLLITDRGLLEMGLLEPVLAALRGTGIKPVGVFHEVPPNSELKAVMACARIGKDNGADGLIAVGGGSVIDTAKAANILLSHGGDLVADYSGAHTLPGPCRPLLAFPTTAGTGSEVTGVAVILDAERHVKLSFLDRFLYPTAALLDPELTLKLPPKLTAATGMDALTHAVEAVTSLQANPVSTAYAATAIRFIRQYLLRATLHGDDREARAHLLVAATLAGVAFDQAMVGVVHGLSHTLGALAPVHHGTANAIFLPWGMEYNLEAAAEGYAQVARWLGVATDNLDRNEAARAAIGAVLRLRQSLYEACGLPLTLTQAGVAPELAEALASGAVEDGTSFYNPRPVVAEELLPLVKQAY